MEWTGAFGPRRELGRTGFVASRLGIGDLADRTVPLDECVATVRRALDAGLNVIDTAPGYEAGYSEEIVGRAVAGHGARDSVFVIDKIDHLDRPVAEQVDASLARMGLGHADAFVFHGCSTMEDWERVARAGGRMDELAECLRAGKARFKGISSHSPGLLRAAIGSGECDIALFAVGAHVDARFTGEILPLARMARVGVIGMKAFGSGKLLGDTEGYGRPLPARPRGKLSSGGTDARDPDSGPALPHLSAGECVRAALTLDPDVALLGLSFPNEQDAAFAAARDFTPMSADELSRVRARAAEAVRGKGPRWWNPPA